MDNADGVDVSVESNTHADEDHAMGESGDTAGDIAANQPGKAKRKRRPTSIVWETFVKLPLGEDKKLRAKCKHCDAIYLADTKNGTRSMRRHIPSCPRTSTRDIGQLLISQDKGSLALSAKRVSPQFLEVKRTLELLFVEYSAGTSKTQNKEGSHVAKNPTSKLSQRQNKVMKEFSTFESQEACVSQKSQLEIYLEEPRINAEVDFDVLDFWKGNQFRYPELSKLARDILSIPISTVASESAFSVGGRVLDQYRSSLKPDIVEALVCTRDWLFGDKDNDTSIRMSVDQICEEVLSMDLNEAISEQSSHNASDALQH